MPDPQTSQEWWPDLVSVAALLRARTLETGRGGDYVDTFTDKTNPTANQVTALIGLAADELAGETEGRTPCTVGLELRAASFLTYRTAQLVEMSYRPEAATDNTSLAVQLGKIADGKLMAIAGYITDRCPLPDGESEYQSSRKFGAIAVVPDRPMLGRRTRWF